MAKIRVFGKATRVGVEEDGVLIDARTEVQMPPDSWYPSGTGTNWEAEWDDPEDALLFAWRKKGDQIQAGAVVLVTGDGLRVVATVGSDGILTGLNRFAGSEAAGWKALLNIVRTNEELSGLCNTHPMNYHRVAKKLELPKEIHFVQFEGYDWVI